MIDQLIIDYLEILVEWYMAEMFWGGVDLMSRGSISIQKRRLQRWQRKGTFPVRRVRKNSRKFLRCERIAVGVPQDGHMVAGLCSYGRFLLKGNVVHLD
jgi:hypothetical protein